MSHSATRGLLRSVDFEVFGKVQGVFFRKHTEKTAQQLQLVGWVKNTLTNTVIGVFQGPEGNVEKMKVWLSTKGSPRSRIDKCDFKNERSLSDLEFKSFSIIRKKK